MVKDLRLVEDVMNVMPGQPDGATGEEMRSHLNQDSGAPGGAPPPLPLPRRAPRPGGAPRPAGVSPPGRAPPPPPAGRAPPRPGPPPHRQGASSHHSLSANDGSDSDSDDSDNPCPSVRRCLYGGPGSTSWTRGSGTTGGAGGVRQGNLVGGVGSGMGDGSSSEEGDVRGAQGDHDTRHVGTGGGGHRTSSVVTGAVGSTPAHPVGTWPSGAGVSSRTPRRPVQPTRGTGWSGWSGARRRSAGPGGRGWSGGRMPTRSGGDGRRAGAGAGGSATT